MRFTKLTIAFIAISLFLNACKSKQTSENNTPGDTTAAAQVEEESASAPAELSPEVRQLVGEDSGMFRGVSLGDPIAEVKSTEKIEQFETSGSHVGFTFEYPNLESADILYYHDKAGKVTKIDVDLYLNEKESLTKFDQELTGYFTQRFGKMSDQNGDKVWMKPGVELVLRDVSKGTNYGLKFTFTAGEKAVTASRN